jgi:hypothetical protein
VSKDGSAGVKKPQVKVPEASCGKEKRCFRDWGAVFSVCFLTCRTEGAKRWFEADTDGSAGPKLMLLYDKGGCRFSASCFSSIDWFPARHLRNPLKKRLSSPVIHWRYFDMFWFWKSTEAATSESKSMEIQEIMGPKMILRQGNARDQWKKHGDPSVGGSIFLNFSLSGDPNWLFDHFGPGCAQDSLGWEGLGTCGILWSVVCGFV